MPALRRLTCPTRAGARGTARLEFAVTVIVFGVIGAFALDRIAHMKGLASVAQRQTSAAQQRALLALDEARCAGAASSAPAWKAASSPLTPFTTLTLSTRSNPSTTHPATPAPALAKGTPLGLANDPVPAPPCPGIAPPSPRFHPTASRKE